MPVEPEAIPPTPPSDRGLLLPIDTGLQAAYARRAEELHNAIVRLLTKENADVYTTLFVIEMIRWELIEQKQKELLG